MDVTSSLVACSLKLPYHAQVCYKLWYPISPLWHQSPSSTPLLGSLMCTV